MNFGLKLWSINQSMLPQAEQLILDDIFQYIELTPIPGTELDAFLSYNLPYTIHITTEDHGLNIAERIIILERFRTVLNGLMNLKLIIWFYILDLVLSHPQSNFLNVSMIKES